MSLDIPQTTSIVDFVKKHYPKIVFKPYKLAYKNALGFIISDGQLLVGYINKNGNICKMVEPVNIDNLTKQNLEEIMRKIPTVEGFNESDKNKLIELFEESSDVISKKEHNEIVKELKDNLKKESANYQVLFDSKNDDVLLIKREYEDKLDKITKLYTEQKDQYEQCKQSVLAQKQEIVDNIKKYEDEIKNYVKSKDLKADELQELYNKMKDEKNSLEKTLEQMILNEKKNIEKLESDENLLKLKESRIIEIETAYKSILADKNKLENSLKELIEQQKSEKLNEEKYLQNVNVELSDKQTKLYELQALYENVKKDNDNLQEKIQILLDNEKKYVDKLSKTDKNDEEMQIRIKELENRFVIIQSEKDDLQNQVNKLLLNEEERQKALSEFEDSIRNKNSKIQELENKISSTIADKTLLEEELSNLKRLIESYSNKIAGEENRYNELQTKYDQIQKILIEKEQRIEELEIEYKKLSSISFENDQRVNELKESYKKVLEEKDILKNKIDEMTVIMQNLDKDNSKKEQMFLEMKQSIDLLEQELNSKNQQLEKILKDLENANNNYYLLQEQIQQKDVRILELQDIYSKIKDENNILQDSLDKAKQISQETEEKCSKEEKKAADIINEYNILLKELDDKKDKLSKLEENVKSITEELEITKTALSKSELKREYMEGYTTRCQKQLLEEKDVIISKIKDYNLKWMDWMGNVKGDYDKYKIKLINELQIITKNLKNLLQTKITDNKMAIKLRQAAKDIEAELKNTISNQLIEINSYKENVKLLEQQKVKYLSEIDKRDKKIDESKVEINQLRKDLNEVKKLLEQNNNTKIQISIDYDNCYNILQNFYALNNVFYRKQEIIKKLDDIIYKGIGSFQNLTESIKSNIITQFEIVKAEINKHIEFLDLKTYISSPNMNYLKNKSTRNKVPKEFCDSLSNLLDYWNENKSNYRDQDKILTNIYEDLSGAVRVYIRIKPLIGVEQKVKTIYMQTIENKKQKSLILDCSNAKNARHQTKSTFGEFYGIFDESYSNEDVYTGIPNSSVDPVTLKVDIGSLEESSENVSPGLYSTFKQVEDGYSVVIFGYGASGSGKTFTLLGSKGMPGLLHYGLSNLEGVQNIKIKYLFEQYYNDKRMNLNFAKIGGRIHNLVREVPQMRDFARNESSEFISRIPNSINLEKIQVNDLYLLTDIIEQYRIEQGRIKKTPNNPVSSRSHLYFVFEITFDTGKVGYITIVDTAGRESPLDIFDTFIDKEKTRLPSIMSPSGGEALIQKTMKEGLDISYTPKHIFEVLKEGFYINESINHLIYFFNNKNYKKTKISLQSQNLDKYNVTSYYVNPIEEENRINESNNCLTMPILKFLDNLSNRNKTDTDWRPTKFITILAVRQEEKYCDQIYETLEFAQSVKSS